MEQFGITPASNSAVFRTAESDALAVEILQHQSEDKNRSYLSQLVTTLTEPFTGNQKSLDHLDALKQKSMLASIAGNSTESSAVNKEINDAVKADFEARKSAGSLSNYSINFAKSVGLFFPGEAGYAISALTNAADSAHPNDSVLRQSADGILGAGKGAVMKFGFEKVGQSDLNLAFKAGALSLTNRFAEVGLNSHTYVDNKTGEFNFAGGLENTFKAIADPRQLGMDALTFGTGYLMLNKLGVTPEFAKANPILAQTITGAGFGFSSGVFSDMQMQQQLHDGVNVGQALKSGLIQMGLTAGAAALGAYRASPLQLSAKPEQQQAPQLNTGETQKSRLDMRNVEGIFGLDRRPVATHHEVYQPSASVPNEMVYSKPSVQQETFATPKVVATTEAQVQAKALAKPAEAQAKLPAEASAKAPAEAQAKAPAEAPTELAGLRIGRDFSQSSIGIREFVSKEDVSGLLSALRAKGTEGRALLNVQELLPSKTDKPQLGPEKTMLIQHVDSTTNAPNIKWENEFGKADLLATCSPQVLEALGVKDLSIRHLFPEAGSSAVMLQVPGSNRLRFSLPDALSKSQFANEPAIPLGKEQSSPYKVEHPREPYQRGPFTISSLLRGVTDSDNMFVAHTRKDRISIPDMAKALEKFPHEARRIIGGGGDSVSFELEDGGILKVTDRPWNPDWGKRTLIMKDGREVRFDARVLEAPKQISVDKNTLTYYMQQRGTSPVRAHDANLFNSLIDHDGQYVFWDQNLDYHPSYGADQLAYVPLQRFKSGMLTAIPLDPTVIGKPNTGLALIDYDAVMVAGTEPESGSSPSWYGRKDFDH